jgi:SAM-dependent methyltransferase
MSVWLPRERRLSFGPVADRYERARPSYPDALVDEVLDYARLEPRDRILEVGAGTGKATRLFAGRGHPIVALEPSAEMAAVARRVCSLYPGVTIVERDFERWEIEPTAFALLLSAQAWHWTDPETRYATARRALRDGGALTVFWNRPDWSSCSLWKPLADAYRSTAPGLEPSGPMHPTTATVDLAADWRAEIEAVSDGFGRPEVRGYPWIARYSAEQYVELLSTHSDHIALSPAIREPLLGRVAEAIDGHGGTLELPYVTRLCLARAV